MTEHQSQYLLLFIALVAIALLIEAIALGALALGVARLLKQVADLAGEAKGRVYPILEKAHSISAKVESISAMTQEIIADASPKIQRVTTNIADTSDVYRAKVAEVDALVSETTSKVHRQTDRVDGMITTALSRTGEMAASVHQAILTPARQLSGLLNGAKVGIDTLIHQFAPKPKPRTPKPVAFEGESVYTGHEDDYHA